MLVLDQVREALVATDEEAVIAKEAAEKLRSVALAGVDVRLRLAEPPGVIVPLPARAVEMIVAVLTAMAERQPISLIPPTAELTAQQAADFLNMSRPHLIELLEKKQIPHRMVGTHRRIRLSDLQVFKGSLKQDAARATGKEAPGSTEEPAEKFGKPDEAFVKEWAAKRTSPVPERVFQEEKPLGIDEVLRSRIDARRGPRILPHRVDNLLRVGRRMLEEAITEAVSQEELHPRQSEWEPKWSRITDTSQDAVDALERLFKAMDPHGKEAELAWSIRRSRAGGIEASNAGLRAADESASRDARLLVEAKQIVGKLHADTLARRAALVAIYPNSYQDHQKWGFVKILAEGWIFLTGKMPSKHRDSLKNPFLRVVEAAWEDWHGAKRGDALAFGEALDAAISSIDEARFEELRARPEWADLRLMAWSVRL